MFYLKDSEKGIKDERMRTIVGLAFDKIVQIGKAACEENISTELKPWMLADYCRKNNVPAVLAHSCRKWLCEAYTFRHHHLEPTKADCKQVEFDEDCITVYGVILDGVYYDAIRVPVYTYAATLFQSEHKPRQVDYDRQFLKRKDSPITPPATS